MVETTEPSFTSSSSLKSAALMDTLRNHLQTPAGKLLKEKVGFVFRINVSPKRMGFEEESFIVDLKNGKVLKGAPDVKADAAFSFVDSDFIAVATGNMNPQMAFLRGKMKIKGSMKAAQKFTPDIFPKISKL